MKKIYKHIVFVCLLVCLNIGMNSETVNAASKISKPVIKVTSVEKTGKIKITWKPVKKAVSYKVYNSQNGKTWKCIATTKKTSVINAKAVAGKKYYYKVKAIASKSANNSNYSKVKSRVCDLARPEVTLSSVTSTGKTKISWKKVSKAVSYQVYASQNKSKWTKIGTVKGTSITHAKAVAGKKYYYKVKAIASKSAANSVYSVIKAKTCKAAEKRMVSYVAPEVIYLYESPTGSSDSIKLLYMTKVELGGVEEKTTSGQWNRVYYQNKMYYIWLTKDSEKLTTEKSSYSYVGNTQVQQEAVDLAKDIALNWKTKYVSQAKGEKLSDGSYAFDCSGFATYVMNTVMQKRVPTYRLTAGTAKLAVLDCVYNKGIKGEFKVVDVALKDIQPGDLIIFSQSEPNNHCGIYLGNNEFAHCSGDAGQNDAVGIMTLGESFTKQISMVRRFLPESIVSADAEEVIHDDGYFTYMYSELGNDDSKVKRLRAGSAVTVLYTGNKENNNQAYVIDEDGAKGFIYTKRYE